jgi:hypothetical protein
LVADISLSDAARFWTFLEQTPENRLDLLNTDLVEKMQSIKTSIESNHLKFNNSNPFHHFGEINPSIDLRNLTELAYGPGRKSGKCVLYRSPFRPNDDSPSFAVYENGFYDFGTGEHGGIINWVMREYGLDEQQAVEFLGGNQAGAALAQRPAYNSPAPSEPPSAQWQEIASAALASAQRHLWNTTQGERVLGYLHDVRGLDDDTIKRYGLGFNRAGHKLDYRIEEKRVYLAPGILIPYHVSGALWAIRIRGIVGNLANYLDMPETVLADGSKAPKYVSLTGSKQSQTLFNADELSPARPVLFVEGEFDTMLAQQEFNRAGVDMAVVTLGSASTKISARWQKVISEAGAKYSALDNDAAGAKGTIQLTERIGAHNALTLAQGKDVTEFVVTFKGDIAKWFNSAIVSPDAQQAFSAGVPDSWRSALLNYVPSAAPVYELLTDAININQLSPDAITVGALAEFALKSGRYGLNEQSIRRGLNQLSDLFFSQVHTKTNTNTVCTREKNSKTGRKSETFKLLTIAEQKTALLAVAAPAILQSHFSANDTDAVLPEISPRAISDTLEIDQAQAHEIAETLRAAFEPIYRAQAQTRHKLNKRVVRAFNALKLGLEDFTSTAITNEIAITSLREYRLAYLRSLKLHSPSAPTSRREIAHAIGITRDVEDYVTSAGFKIEGNQTAQCDLKAGRGEIHKQIYEIERNVRGKAIRFSVEGDGKEFSVSYSTENLQTVITPALAQGRKVTVVCQVANKHTALDEIPASEKPQRAQRPERSAQQETPARPAPSPAPHDEFKTGYRASWLKAHISNALARLGWATDDRFYNPETGEVKAFDASLGELIELVTGLGVETKQVDSLIYFAVTGLNAVVRRVN